MRRSLIAVAALLALASSGCTGAADGPATSSADVATVTPAADGALPSEAAALLSAQPGLQLTGRSVTDLVTELDQLDARRPLAVQASVRQAEVVLGEKGGRQVAVAIPGDRTYVSVAPYLRTTHECHFHALGGCQGEMTKAKVHVTITDSSGATLVDEDATTYANGFVGYWLPRDTTGTIRVTQGGRTGEAPFSTAPGEATCITTLRLA